MFWCIDNATPVERGGEVQNSPQLVLIKSDDHQLLAEQGTGGGRAVPHYNTIRRQSGLTAGLAKTNRGAAPALPHSGLLENWTSQSIKCDSTKMTMFFLQNVLSGFMPVSLFIFSRNHATSELSRSNRCTALLLKRLQRFTCDSGLIIFNSIANSSFYLLFLIKTLWEKVFSMWRF